jgi:hypothetical protein
MARKRDDTVKLVLRLPPALHRRLTRIAARQNQSLNNEMIKRLEESLARDAEKLQSYRDVRALSEHMARQGRETNPLTGEKLTELSNRIDKLIAVLEAQLTEDDGERK